MSSKYGDYFHNLIYTAISVTVVLVLLYRSYCYVCPRITLSYHLRRFDHETCFVLRRRSLEAVKYSNKKYLKVTKAVIYISKLYLIKIHCLRNILFY